MVKIETLKKAVVALNNEGYYHIADEITEEIQKRKRNNQKQKEEKQRLSNYFNQEILRVIKRSQKPLSAEEIEKELKNNGFTKNPVTRKLITSRMITVRCQKMFLSKDLDADIEKREKMIIKPTLVFSTY